MNGKLIVITGIDGSGKTVQTDLLAERLKGEGYSVEQIDFPQYGKTFFADMVARYLQGDFNPEIPLIISNDTQSSPEHTKIVSSAHKPTAVSNPGSVNPYFTSLLYAGDRWECRDKITESLDEGKIIISNRYTCCNKAYQGAKIGNKKEMERFFDWLDMLEHQVYKIPIPDMIIFLQSDVEIALDLIRKRPLREYHCPDDGLDQGSPVKRTKQRDIHEENIDYLKLVQKRYLELASSEKGWEKIECIREGKILDKYHIAEEVWNVVRNKI